MPNLVEYYGLKEKKGVLVTQVFDGDPADKAGIKTHDVIVAVDGKSVESSRELSSTIAGVPVGKESDITVLRNGKKKTVQTLIAKRDESKRVARRQPQSNEEFGLQAAELTPELVRRFGYSENEAGVLILSVKPDSKADRAGIQQGDLVKEISRKSVKTVSDLASELKKEKFGKSVQLLVKRPNAGFVIIKIA